MTAAQITKLEIDISPSNFIFHGITNAFPNLKQLHIRASELHYLKRDNFKSLSQLELLDFSHTPIYDVSDESFIDMVNFKIFLLRKCNIATISAKWFSFMNKLETLNMYGNQISHLPEGLFQNNMLLSNVDFRANRIKIIDAVFHSLTEIDVIDLKTNKCIDDIFQMKSETREEKVVKLNKAVVKVHQLCNPVRKRACESCITFPDNEALTRNGN